MQEKITFLEKENAILKERLAAYQYPKNSRNSSIPPSKDDNKPKRTKSLRKPSGKKPGGQLGRQGNTLKMVAKPDNVVSLIPHYCRSCDHDLQAATAIKLQSRQVVDIPPIQAIYTEYQTYSKQCSCGCVNRTDFPAAVNSPISYGPVIESLVSYFHTRQYLPFLRMKEMFNDVFNIGISEGGLHCLLNRFATKATPVYEIIKQKVVGSKVVGSDETGLKINGKTQWMWTWQSPTATFIVPSSNRGSATIKTHFPQGFLNSVLVTDGWKPQLKTPALSHQSCIAHLLRRLNYLNEKYNKHSWSVNFKQLLCQAIELKKQTDFKSVAYLIARFDMVRQLDELLKTPPEKKHKELHTFYKRMCRERQYLLVFLYLEEVPFDNNASERAIRNIKVKQKISGQFKSEKSALNFAKIRSVIDTTIKNGLNVFDALNLIAKLQSTIRGD